MIVSKCPVRISVAGGSTDLDSFIQKNGRGAVISFSANLYTYIAIFRDKFGQNALGEKYHVVYSETESTKNICDIKNDVARVALKKLAKGPLNCWFTADVPSSGSGLASSSSHMLSLVNAINELENLGLSKKNVIKTSWELEKEFNPLTGFQDPYGCAIGGLNMHEKTLGKEVTTTSLDTSIFNNFSMFLLPTFLNRSSTDVLNSIKNNIDDRLLSMVYDMHTAIIKKDTNTFISLIKEGWALKKSTSPIILGHQELKEIDQLIESHNSILAHRLIGAGNGGYYLLIAPKEIKKSDLENDFNKTILPIAVDYNGLTVS